MTDVSGGAGGTGGTGGVGNTGGGDAGGGATGGAGNVPGGGSAPGVGGTPGGAAPAWYDSATQDAEARTWIQNKGWQDHNAMIASHRSLEKLIGVDPKSVVRLPKAGDVEGRDAFYKQLGRPDSADKYSFGEAEKTLDPAYATAAKDFFHKAGLTAEQANAVVAANAEYINGVAAKQQADYQLAVQAGEQQLQDEWRGGYDRMIGKATQTSKALGFTAEMIDGIEAKVGYAGTMKFLAGLGDKIGEDSFISEDSGKKQFAGNLTPQEATREWDSLKLDQNFLAALMDKDNPGHKGARDKQTRLFQVMYPQ